MPTLTADNGQRSAPIGISWLSGLEATNGYVEYTTATLVEAKAGIAVWTAWPVGATAGTAYSLMQMVVRLVGTSDGATCVITDPRELIRADSFSLPLIETNPLLWALPNGQLYRAGNVLAGQVSAPTIEFLASNTNVTCIGNSLTFGVGSSVGGTNGAQSAVTTKGYTAYLQTIAPLTGLSAIVYNQGRSASTITLAALTAIGGGSVNYTQRPENQEADANSKFAAGRENNIAIFASPLRNEIYANVGTAQDALDELVDYITAIKAVHPDWYIVVATDYPGFQQLVGAPFMPADISVYNTRLNEANNLIRAQWRDFADALADVAALPEFTPPDYSAATFASNAWFQRTAPYSGTVYYDPDSVHLNDAGYAKVGDCIAEALTRIPARAPAPAPTPEPGPALLRWNDATDVGTITESGNGTDGWIYQGPSGGAFTTQYFGIADTPKIPVGAWVSLECSVDFPTFDQGMMYVATSASPVAYTNAAVRAVLWTDLSGPPSQYFRIVNGTAGAGTGNSTGGVANNRYRLRRTADQEFVAEVSTDGAGASWTVIYTYAVDTGGDYYVYMALTGTQRAYRPRGEGLTA